MAENSVKAISKKTILIIALVLIAAAIGAIFIFKNSESVSAADGSEFALDATEDFDFDKILSYGLPVIIDFGSDSCIPCKEMAPTLEELNVELRGKAVVKFVDVWVNTDAANQLPIRVIPTQFFFDKDGKPYVPEDDEGMFLMYADKETGEHVFTTHEGAMSKEDILEVFEGMGVK